MRSGGSWRRVTPRRGRYRRQRGETGLSASQLFTWRRLARDGQLEEADSETTFAPVLVGDDSSRCSLQLPPEQPDPSLSPQVHPSAVSGRIEIVLMSGHRVIVDSDIDATVLARVLAVLERP